MRSTPEYGLKSLQYDLSQVSRRFSGRRTCMYIECFPSSETTPCCPYMNRRFGGIHHVPVQGRQTAEQETSLQDVAKQNKPTDFRS
jgi:hypothetical protein